jgi:hypothetical protein
MPEYAEIDPFPVDLGNGNILQVSVLPPLGCWFAGNIQYGCFISKVNPDSNASKETGIQAGCRITAINGTSTVGLDKSACTALVKNGTGTCDLEMVHDPQGLAAFNAAPSGGGSNDGALPAPTLPPTRAGSVPALSLARGEIGASTGLQDPLRLRVSSAPSLGPSAMATSTSPSTPRKSSFSSSAAASSTPSSMWKRIGRSRSSSSGSRPFTEKSPPTSGNLNTVLEGYNAGGLVEAGLLMHREHSDSTAKLRHVFLYERVLLVCKLKGKTYSVKEVVVLDHQTDV